jgi:hypothetical protein
MKVKTKQTVETEVEVQLPYFFKNTITGSIYAVLTEKCSLVIREREISTFTYAQPVAQFIGNNDCQQITAEEFTTAFDNHLQSLGQLKSLFFQKQTA